MNAKQQAKYLLDVFKTKEVAIKHLDLMTAEIDKSIRYIKLNNSERQMIDDNIDFWNEVKHNIKLSN